MLQCQHGDCLRRVDLLAGQVYWLGQWLLSKKRRNEQKIEWCASWVFSDQLFAGRFGCQRRIRIHWRKNENRHYHSYGDKVNFVTFKGGIFYFFIFFSEYVLLSLREGSLLSFRGDDFMGIFTRTKIILSGPWA